MKTTLEPWRRRTRLVLATLVVSAFALTICQQCLSPAMGQSDPGDPPSDPPCQAGPET